MPYNSWSIVECNSCLFYGIKALTNTLGVVFNNFCDISDQTTKWLPGTTYSNAVLII